MTPEQNKEILSQLMNELQMELDSGTEFIQELRESAEMPEPLLQEYIIDLTLLQNKHIPAKIFSVDKLIERNLKCRIGNTI